MPVQMTQEQIDRADPLKRHIHPKKILIDIIEVIRKVGSAKFLKSPEYKKQRELFIASMFAYTIREYRQTECYIQEVAEGQDPPDFHLLLPTKRPKHDKPFDFANIELVQIPKNIDEKVDRIKTAREIITRTKLTNYRPGEGTILLIFVNSTYANSIIQDIKKFFIEGHEKFKLFSDVLTIHLKTASPEVGFEYVVNELSEGWTITQKLTDQFKKDPTEHHLIEEYRVELIDEPTLE